MFESIRQRLADYISGDVRDRPGRARDWMPFLDEATPGFKRAAHILANYDPLDRITTKMERAGSPTLSRTSTAQDALRVDYQKWISEMEKQGYTYKGADRYIEREDRGKGGRIEPQFSFTPADGVDPHPTKVAQGTAARESGEFELTPER